MEKVDILELTVGYLRELRRLHMNRLPLLPLQQQPHQQQQQQHPHQQQQHQYRDGYLSAMSEVRDLLTRQHGMTEMSNRLAAHLQGTLLRNGDRPATASTAAAVPVAHQAGTQGQSRMSSTLSTAGSRVPDSLHLAARLQHHHLPAATSSPALFPLSLQFYPSQDQQQTTAPSSTRGEEGGLLMTSSARNGGEGLLMTSRASSSHFLSPPYTNPQPRRHGNNQQMLLINDNVVHSASEDINLRGVKAKVTDSLSPSIVTFTSADDVSLSDDSSSSSSSDGKIHLSPQFVWRPF